ncbi:MAG TPA: hypothetical protein PKD54_10940 [Pirellulaceae bacterium]|nr:hypothetical protein [Pirellulaceae bacterium]
MLKNTLAIAVTICLGITGIAQAQYYSDITAWYDQHVQQQNQNFQRMEQQITQRNMQDPQVQMMYQQYLNQGGQGSLEQYAYGYAATGGYTQQGIQYYNRVMGQINQQDAEALRNYHNHVNQLWADTNAYRNDVYNRIAYQRGELLSGNGTYVNPHTGYQHQLPYTSGTGTVHTDYYGNMYQIDSQGNYWVSNGNGYWQPMYRR